MKTIRRRRLEKKTDYKLRFGLLKSGKTRLVIRKTNKYLIAQIVSTEIAQDKVLIGMSTKDLLSNGWPKEKSGSLKSLPACYSLGFILGKEMKTKKISESILDLGMHRNIHKSRIYALVKGVIDAGISIPCSEEALPTEQDLKRNDSLTKIMEKIIK